MNLMLGIINRNAIAVDLVFNDYIVVIAFVVEGERGEGDFTVLAV